MTIEAKYGVPTVAMHTDNFDKVVRSVADVNGMPGLAQVFVPQPIMGKTPGELRAYVDGTDPTTGRSVMQEVIEGLTLPRDGARARVEYDRSTPRLVEADTEEHLHRVFLERNWTDHLPIVLPTEARVAAMLAGTRRKPDEVVGRMRSTHFREYWEYTVEKVAVNAVMAGARPDYFPVILALARARRPSAARHGPARAAGAAARSDRRAPVRRPRRLRQEGRAHRLAPRHRAHEGGRVLGLPAHPELHLPAGDVRRGAVGEQAQGGARRGDSDVPARGHPRDRGRG